MKRLTTRILSAALVVVSLGALAADETATDQNDVILAGYDAVAYFTVGRPVKGSGEFTAQHDGAIYHFSSAANRDVFKQNPNQYAPAYGGYCAFGASLGKKFHVDGEAFEIVENRLYVNKNKAVYETWRKDIPGNILKAEGQWVNIQSVSVGEL